MLTRQQSSLLRFVHGRLTENGVPPSFDEMKDALDLKSKSGIHRLLLALEERGFIRRLPNRARALEVIRLPDNYMPRVGAKALPDDAPSADVARAISIPVMGRIAAVTPLKAISEQSGAVRISSEFLSHGEHFALSMRGDSMIEAGIFDGDLVVIRKQETADSHDIVLAVIDDEEATLKRFRCKGETVALEAANPNYETRIFGPDRVRIAGKMTSLHRRF